MIEKIETYEAQLDEAGLRNSEEAVTPNELNHTNNGLNISLIHGG